MSNHLTWWTKPRQITVVVDNPSWILSAAKHLVEDIQKTGDEAILVRNHNDIPKGDIAFYLGCTHITPPDILARNRRNLVVHESNLPEGRGFSPLTWQILEGKNIIPFCLLEAVDKVDAGAVILRDELHFQGHELIEEMRDVQAKMTRSLCKRFLDAPTPQEGETQKGKVTTYQRRSPDGSRLDPQQSIAELFSLLRVVDNERYPAFFEFKDHYYELKISKRKDR